MGVSQPARETLVVLTRSWRERVSTMLGGSAFPMSRGLWGDLGWAGFGVYVDQAVHGGCVVRVVGELDCVSAELMRDALSLASQMSGDLLVVDVAWLTFMNVAGLRVRLSTHERLVAAGGGG